MRKADERALVQNVVGPIGFEPMTNWFLREHVPL